MFALEWKMTNSISLIKTRMTLRVTAWIMASTLIPVGTTVKSSILFIANIDDNTISADWDEVWLISCLTQQRLSVNPTILCCFIADIWVWMSATVLGRAWAFSCPMLPTKECSSGTRVQDVAECIQTQQCWFLPIQNMDRSRNWRQLFSSHPPLTSASTISRDTFCLIALVHSFCCHIIFYSMTGELGAVLTKHSEGQCPVKGRTEEVEPPDWQLGEVRALWHHLQKEQPPSHCPEQQAGHISNQVNAL